MRQERKYGYEHINGYDDSDYEYSFLYQADDLYVSMIHQKPNNKWDVVISIRCSSDDPRFVSSDYDILTIDPSASKMYEDCIVEDAEYEAENIGQVINEIVDMINKGMMY